MDNGQSECYKFANDIKAKIGHARQATVSAKKHGLLCPTFVNSWPNGARISYESSLSGFALWDFHFHRIFCAVPSEQSYLCNPDPRSLLNILERSNINKFHRIKRTKDLRISIKKCWIKFFV